MRWARARRAARVGGPLGVVISVPPVVTAAGAPMLVGLAALAVVVLAALGALCWVLADSRRSECLAMVIRAARGAPPLERPRRGEPFG
ncbi:hypothetical protein AGRA3207_003259 [Actinomadura graeca]|uniref:Uncharacterized protein n=1 Tax=Actinomadura graeca TaxID=2750812 RepID=A0ABX8QVQ4_9ACTN|nr:hypothetical protein [Actinomadura graeca]QXJ22279.1 hypothetical protein AGRA3207_003259 [Actinomadura graeca]